MQKLLLFCLLLFLFSCGNKIVPTANKSNEITIEIEEDLAVYRNLEGSSVGPSATNEVNGPLDNIGNENNEKNLSEKPLYINDKVDAYLAEKAAKNRNVKYANGFRIQLYVGRERKIVDDAKIFIYQTYPNINPYLTYSLPIYKLKIGDFITRTEAERLLNQLKPMYPEAIIISEKIDVKKSFGKE